MVLFFGPAFVLPYSHKVQLLFYPIAIKCVIRVSGIVKGGRMALKIHVHMDVTISNRMVGTKLKNPFAEQLQKLVRKLVWSVLGSL